MAQVKNFAKATVLNLYDAVATSIVLQSGHAAKLPSTTPFNVVWWNATDFSEPSDDPNVEIVRVTNIVGDTLTVTRAQEGTAASTKNTAGKTYKMVAGLTAKGAEAMGFGAGASPPAYIQDIRGGTSLKTQFHLTDHDADDGMYVMGASTPQSLIMVGCLFDGVNFIAKNTTAMIWQFNAANGLVALYRDSGLTVGNTFSPTVRATFDLTVGNFGFAGIVTPNVSLDTPGALATRFLSATLANGLNSNIAIGTSGNIRATGPTGAYSLGGFANGFDGRELYFFNPLTQTVTIVNADASSSAANRINTLTGANVILAAAANSWARFKYDSTTSLWILNDHN